MKNHVLFLPAILMLSCLTFSCQKADSVSSPDKTASNRLESYQVPLPLSTKAADSDIYITVVYDSEYDTVVSASLSEGALSYYGITESVFDDIFMNKIIVQETKGDPYSEIRTGYYKNVQHCKSDYEKGWERTRCVICYTVEFAVACLDAVLD